VVDDVPLILVTERSLENPLSSLITKDEQPRMTTSVHSDEMPKTLRVNFLTSMLKTKMLA
jgi:hypothetical protein